MRVVLRVDNDAPRHVHDLARLTEDAFDRVQEQAGDGPYTYKTDIIRRMTDAQVQRFETDLEQASVRMRQMWFASQAIYHRSPEYPGLYAEFVEAYGMAEADRLLAVSGR